MRQISAIEMREIMTAILSEVDHFCRARNMQYYLWAGTLLGAVRHEGFIPWDDDIDVAMPRPDFDRFCREFPLSAPWHLSLRTMDTDPNYGLPYGKLEDRRTRVEGGSKLAPDSGINIDVFPIDDWPDGRTAAALHRLRMTWHHRVAAVWTDAYNPTRSRTKSFVMAALRPAVRLLPIRRLAGNISRAAQAVSTRHGSEFVGVTTFRYLERVERDAYGESQDIDFEGRRLLAPEHPGRILERLYGDYLSLPPESERREGWHASSAHWVDATGPYGAT